MILPVVLCVLLQSISSSALDPSGAWRLNRALSSESADNRDASTRLWLTAADTLVLRLADGAVTFHDQDGLRRIYRLGKSAPVVEASGERIGSAASWDGVTLRIEHRVSRRRQVIETFSVTPDRQRLTLTIVLREAGLTTTDWIRRVYDPVR